MTWLRSCLAACLPGCFRAHQASPASTRSSSFCNEKPPSPTPVMEPVLSLSCQGVVNGHERNVFVAVKTELHRGNVRVTQLARPSDVLLMFYDITDEDVDAEEILKKVSIASAESGAQEVVLVVMYRDYEGNSFAGFQDSGRQRLGDKAWRKLEDAVSLLVDMVFEDDVDAGVLDCLQNAYALHHVVQYLKGVVRQQNAMLTGDSFTISRAINQQTAVTPPDELGIPQLYNAPPGKAVESPMKEEVGKIRAAIPGKVIKTTLHPAMNGSFKGGHVSTPSSQYSSGSPHAPSSPRAVTPSCSMNSGRSQTSQSGSSSENATPREPTILPRTTSQKGPRTSRSSGVKARKRSKGGRNHPKRLGRKGRDDGWKRNLTWGGWEYQNRSIRTLKGGRNKLMPPLSPQSPNGQLDNDEIRAVVGSCQKRSPIDPEVSVFYRSCDPSKEHMDITSAFCERSEQQFSSGDRASPLFDGNLFLEFVPQ